MPPIYHPINEWPLKLCNVKEAWELPLPAHGLGKSKGEGVLIVHPDTGWTEHPELIKGGRYLTDIRLSKNFFGQWSEYLLAQDTLVEGLLLFPSHGTKTASLMLSEEGHPNTIPANPEYPNYNVDSDLYVTGIAPKVEVIPLRVSDSVVLGSNYTHHATLNTYATLGKAIDYTLSLNDVGVISISLGGINEHPALNISLKYSRQSGVIICAAAGQAFNTGGIRKPSFPGNSPHTICVAGCYKNFDKPSEGFYGKAVDISAPGWGVIVAETKKNPPFYVIDQNGEGTSFATAITAGACALWLAFHNRSILIKKYGRPFLHNVFKYVLQQSCKKDIQGWDSNTRGAGFLDVKALLEYKPLPDVRIIEDIAKEDGWVETDWGPRNKWGRE
jgi:serine protease